MQGPNVGEASIHSTTVNEQQSMYIPTTAQSHMISISSSSQHLSVYHQALIVPPYSTSVLLSPPLCLVLHFVYVSHSPGYCFGFNFIVDVLKHCGMEKLYLMYVVYKIRIMCLLSFKLIVVLTLIYRSKVLIGS